jgi:hypothetical protein
MLEAARPSASCVLFPPFFVFLSFLALFAGALLIASCHPTIAIQLFHFSTSSKAAESQVKVYGQQSDVDENNEEHAQR